MSRHSGSRDFIILQRESQDQRHPLNIYRPVRSLPFLQARHISWLFGASSASELDRLMWVHGSWIILSPTVGCGVILPNAFHHGKRGPSTLQPKGTVKQPPEPKAQFGFHQPVCMVHFMPYASHLPNQATPRASNSKPPTPACKKRSDDAAETKPTQQAATIEEAAATVVGTMQAMLIASHPAANPEISLYSSICF